MSDPASAASAAAPTPDLIQAPAAAPDTSTAVSVDIPADGGFPADPAPDPVPAVDPAVAAAADPGIDPKPHKKSAYEKRIDTLHAQREAERRRADEAEKRAALFEAMAAGKPPVADPNVDPAALPTPSPGAFASKADFDKAVEERATLLEAQKTAKTRMDGLLKAGRGEFKDFDDRCNTIASLGAGDRGDFMQIMTDPSIIPDGQKVIAHLADNPDEAARILAMDTVPMTAALVKFQAEMSRPAPPKPISGAPPPIKTLDGTARTDTEPKDSDDMATYAAKYKTIQAKKMQEKAPSRFARY